MVWCVCGVCVVWYGVVCVWSKPTSLRDGSLKFSSASWKRGIITATIYLLIKYIHVSSSISLKQTFALQNKPNT